MRKDLGAKPYTYPQPVFILTAYGEDGTPNVMNAAWGGVSDTTELTMCISAGHKTTKDILARGAFTVSMGDAAHVTACDYVGLVSGNEVPDKLARAGFSAVRAAHVDAPLIEQLSVAVECRLKSYDPATGHLVGEIVNVSVDESVIGADGRVDTAAVRPICFDPFNDTYVALGEVVGKAFSAGEALK